jgi:hypothetical protein
MREYEIRLTEHTRFRQQIRISGLPFTKPGRYVFCSQYRDEEDADWREGGVAVLDVTLRYAQDVSSDAVGSRDSIRLAP